MDKSAITDYPLHELLRRRYSPRAYSDRAVTDRQLHTLFAAARWAPSSFNEQPWRFLVANRTDEEAYRRMLGCIAPNNAAWAGSAAALFVAVASTRFSRNGKPNRHAFYDVGQAVAMLSVQATAMDLYVHQMAGYDRDKVREVYRVPTDFETVVAAAIGYLGDPDDLPAALAERERMPRARKPLGELVIADTWPSS